MLDGDPFLYFSDLLVLLVILLPAHFLVPWHWMRQLLLGLAGAYLIFLIAPRLLLFYLMFWLLVFVAQLAATLFRDRRAGWMWTALLVGLVLTPMVAWKLSPEWFVPEFNLQMNTAVTETSAWLGAIDRVRNLIIPIGLSFATFRAIDQVIKVRLEILAPLKPLEQFAFGFFPPVQVIGPVIEYTEIEDGLRRRTRFDPNDMLSGVMTVAIGAVKVFLFAYLLRGSSDVFQLGTYNGTAWQYWLELTLFAGYFYFNFSGFSDMAIGSARLLGFRLAPNFNNPYLKTNPQDFWNSWHMSLTRFAQRNVFVPMGGMRSRTQYPAIVSTMMVIALWHDLSLPLVLFGVYHATGLVLHRLWVSRHPVPKPRPVVRRLAANLVFFVYYLISLPLLSLDLSQLPLFYERLLL